MTCEHIDDPRCPRADCLHPHGVCVLSLHRINTQHMAAPVSVHMGRVEQRPAILPPTERISRPALALSTYRVYRTANRSRAEAFRHALRVLRQRT